MTDLNELFKVISEGKKHYEETDPKGKILKETKQHVKDDLSALFASLTAIKEELEVELVEAVAQKEEALINEIATLVAEETLTEEVPLPTIKTPEERKIETQNTVDRYLTGKSFQQPDPDVVDKNIEAIRNKIKFLEQAIGKIAATGPGGGAGEIYNLDMPTKTVTGDYTIGRKDYYIGVDHSVKTYITLPTDGANLKNGRIVVIKDESGHAQLTPIKIVGTIDNDPNGAEIRINNGAVQLLYSNGQWRII